MNCAYDLDCLLPQMPQKKGRFLKGHEPFNKGKKWSEWLDGRKARRIKRILLSYRQYNYKLGGWNKKQVVGISIEGKACVFESAEDASRKLGINGRNIRHCCEGKRNLAGGIFFMWAENWNGSTELTEKQKRIYDISNKRKTTKEAQKHKKSA